MKRLKESVIPEIAGIVCMLLVLFALIKPEGSVKADPVTQLYNVTVKYVHGVCPGDTISKEDADAVESNTGTVETKTFAFEPAQKVKLTAPAKKDGRYISGWSVVTKGKIPFFPYKGVDRLSQDAELGFSMPQTDLVVLVFYKDSQWTKTVNTYVDGAKVDEKTETSDDLAYNFQNITSAATQRGATKVAIYAEGNITNASANVNESDLQSCTAGDVVVNVYARTTSPVMDKRVVFGEKSIQACEGVPVLVTVEGPINTIKNAGTLNGAKIVKVFHQADETNSGYTPYVMVRVMVPMGGMSDVLDVTYNNGTWSNANVNATPPVPQPASNGVISTGRLEIIQGGNKIVIDADDMHDNRNRVIQLETQLNNVRIVKVGSEYFLQLGNDASTRRKIQ